MQQTNSPFDVIGLVQEFLLDRPVETPDLFRDKLKEFAKPGAFPPPLAVQNIAELIYAWRNQLPEEMKAIGVQAVNVLVFHQQFNYQAGRGTGIVVALTGVEGKQPAPDTNLTPAVMERQGPGAILPPAPETLPVS